MANVEGGDIWTPDQVRNLDVVGVVERIDKCMYEIMESESAMLNSIEEYDLERIKSYNAALRNYTEVVYKSNRMDLPHSYPSMYQIKYLTLGKTEYDETKNKNLRDLLRLYANAMVQWSRSESADKSNGYYDADYSRFELIMDRIDGYINAYVEESTPLDWPESSTFEDAQNNG